MALTGSTTSSFSYSIEIIFTPEVFGTFRQTVVFDFKGKPKVAKEIVVEVVPRLDEESKLETDESMDQQASKNEPNTSNMFGRNLKTRGTWHFGNADIVDSTTGIRVSSNKVGFALMTSPTLSKIENQPEKQLQCPLTKDNYKERMRKYLHAQFWFNW
jgi:hypothetical protein